MDVVVFSASREPVSRHAELAYELGKGLARHGHRLINGGGPGLMDQALRGAADHQGRTHAIRLEKHARTHSDAADSFETFHDLWSRQKRLISLGEAFVALPGGLGTFYEVFEILALKNAGQMPLGKPLIILGPQTEKIKGLLASLVHAGYAEQKTWAFLQFADSVEQCLTMLEAKG